MTTLVQDQAVLAAEQKTRCSVSVLALLMELRWLAIGGGASLLLGHFQSVLVMLALLSGIGADQCLACPIKAHSGVSRYELGNDLLALSGASVATLGLLALLGG